MPDTAFTFVDQRFRLDGRGQIYGSGEEGEAPMLIVEGTGDFEDVKGTYAGTGLPVGAPSGTGTLEFAFDLDD